MATRPQVLIGPTEQKGGFGPAKQTCRSRPVTLFQIPTRSFPQLHRQGAAKRRLVWMLERNVTRDTADKASGWQQATQNRPRGWLVFSLVGRAEGAGGGRQKAGIGSKYGYFEQPARGSMDESRCGGKRRQGWPELALGLRSVPVHAHATSEPAPPVS